MAVENQITWRERATKDHEGKVPYPKIGVLRDGKSLLPEPPASKAASPAVGQPVQPTVGPPMGQPISAAAVRNPITLPPPAPAAPIITETASIVAGPPERRKRAI
jgi:hypothetical protein